jgi:hypothetical protein
VNPVTAFLKRGGNRGAEHFGEGFGGQLQVAGQSLVLAGKDILVASQRSELGIS